MKHMQTDKYTIAWFKIADYVSRGEKERALGVYRLLSHSFNDDAVARQLEADIYFSCNEQERAIILYRQAMELYQKSKRFTEAAAICEHLLLLLPHDASLRREIILCYNNIKLASKIYVHAQRFVEMYARENKWQDIEHFIHDHDSVLEPLARLALYQPIIIATNNVAGHTDLAHMCIQKTVTGLLCEEYECALQEFFAALRAVNEDLHKYALDCLK